MTAMTSRERVLTAIAHEEPDRVPIILGTNMNTSPVHQAYDRLKTLLNVEAKTEFLYFEALGTVRIEETILQRLGSDARGLQDRLPRHIRDRDAANPDATIHFDDWQVGREEVEPGDYFPLVHPLRDVTSLDALETFEWPDMADPTRLDGLTARARTLAEEGQYAIFGTPLLKYPLEQACQLRGMDVFMMDLVANEDFAHALLSKLVGLFKTFFERYLAEVGSYLDVLCLGDDLGIQSGLLMSPKTYRRMLKPYHAELINFVRERTDAYIYFHSDGDVSSLMADLIEIGVDILNPIQISAGQMSDLGMLKKRYGDNICFCGAIDTHRILPFGTPKEVRAEVRRIISLLGPDGGYLLSSVHAMQKDVPPENILAMCDAAREFGQYPLA
jgi:uroporphyrinogen decarboxylase